MVTSYVIPITSHSTEDKTTEIVKRLVAVKSQKDEKASRRFSGHETSLSDTKLAEHTSQNPGLDNIKSESSVDIGGLTLGDHVSERRFSSIDELLQMDTLV